MPLVEQELLTLPEHLSSSPVFSGVRVTQSLVLCVCIVDRCLSICTFLAVVLCVFFFDIQILITLLVSSNSSFKHICTKMKNVTSLFFYLFFIVLVFLADHDVLPIYPLIWQPCI